ncbi:MULTISPECIES: sulfotransferase family 2 domain-containing protein [Halomonadaceae]|uniref:Sulfotransferase family protein n=1 Tax=Vreelandella halophila TaxID=86177 RepID=A0A9X4Y9F4_9GAMM|nr:MULTISPECIES: sulfotransferase family 2 domain-containing protein [Halomonas]MYL25278.1 hypothetical protein [Halomonas utahensis]MYL75340.1 hypothetical protein [Halomonas sp. 22501_18_FS]
MQLTPYTPGVASLYATTLWHLATRPGSVRALRNKTRKNKQYNYQGPIETGLLFVHIPKCAGIALNHALYHSLGPGHEPVMRYLHASSPNVFLNTYKFTVVRNPWDRLVSAYNFLSNGGFNEKDRAFFDNHLSGYRSFDDFVRSWLTPATMHRTPHFQPQTHYLSLNRHWQTPLDDLCFFETLDQDLASAPHPRLNALTLQRRNASTTGTDHYLEYYSPESLNIVSELYQQDIEALGYTPDNSTLGTQMAYRDQRFRS